jgi:ApaG protein
MSGYAFDAGSPPSETTFTSETVTRGIRVKVVSRYSAAHSQPHFKRWFFLYTVSIANESSETVRLISRHWIIEDATGKREEVRGPGVVGEQPVLAPGQNFEYTSGCPLATSFGSMRGTYQMVTERQEMFDAEIAPFTLSEPIQVH